MNAQFPLPEVTKFVVRIPSKSSIGLSDLRARLQAELPLLSFRFERSEDAAVNTIAVVPVMEDSKGRAHICRAPDRSTLLRIHNLTRDALFDPIQA